MDLETIQRYQAYSAEQEMKHKKAAMEHEIRATQISNLACFMATYMGYLTMSMLYSAFNPER